MLRNNPVGPAKPHPDAYRLGGKERIKDIGHVLFQDAASFILYSQMKPARFLKGMDGNEGFISIKRLQRIQQNFIQGQRK